MEAFHADHVRHAAWLEAISQAHIALWRQRKADPDAFAAWQAAHRAAGFYLFLAGWDGRTVSFLFSARNPLVRQACDDSTPRALRLTNAANYALVEVPKVKYERATPTLVRVLVKFLTLSSLGLFPRE